MAIPGGVGEKLRSVSIVTLILLAISSRSKLQTSCASLSGRVGGS